jgi:hypothetical protein
MNRKTKKHNTQLAKPVKTAANWYISFGADLGNHCTSTNKTPESHENNNSKRRETEKKRISITAETLEIR